MNIQDKFDLYIEGLLSKEEMQALEDQFKSDPDLFENFKEYSKVNLMLKNGLASPILDCEGDAILEQLSLHQRLSIEEDVSEYLLDTKLHAGENEKDFRELLKSLKNKSKGRRKRKSLSIDFLIKIAAAIVILFLSSVLVIRNFDLSNKQLSAALAFQKYYDPVNDKSLKSFGSSDIIMRKAIIAFRKDDYASANSSLDMISKEYDTEYMYHIMKGLILLEESKLSNAKVYFTTAMNEAESSSRFIGKWYFGLTLLKENNIQEASVLFTELSKVNNPYKKRAEKILNSLNRK